MTQLASHNSSDTTRVAPESNVSVGRAILVVSGGELSGARMDLDVGQTYSIGADERSDIVLRGAVADGSSMQVTLKRDGISVQYSDRRDVVQMAYQDKLTFGSGQFFIVQNDESSKLSPDTSANPIDTNLFNDMQDATPANAADVGTVAEPLAKPVDEKAHNTEARRFLRPVAYASFIVLICIGVGAAVLWQSGRFSAPVVAIVPFESTLADAGFEQLSVDRSSGTTVVSGYVQSRQQALDLADVIRTHSEPVLNRVQVDAEIKDQIENVMRVNGITGLVESTGNGVFIANTQLPLGAELDSLQSLIENDVPSVATFTVNNQLPLEPQSDSLQLDAGKRVVLVNSEKPSYVVTEDQSRYFVGSILPGGYRITDISDGRVLLEKKGKTTELKF